MDYFEKLGTKKELDKKYNYLESSKNVKDVVYGIPSYAYLNGILYNKEGDRRKQGLCPAFLLS